MSIEAMLVWAVVIVTGMLIARSHDKAAKRDRLERQNRESSARKAYAQAYIKQIEDRN